MLEQARDDDERAALGPRLDLHIDDARDGIDRHVTKQRDAVSRQIISERQTLIQRAAALEHDNDDKLDGLAEANASAAAELARINGEPEAPATENARSAIWKTAIDQRLANGNGTQALTLFDQVKDRLTPADRLSLDAPLQVARADQTADQWIARETATNGPLLKERLDADPNLPLDTKYVVRAKVDARDSAAESKRAATIQQLDDQVRDAVHARAGNPTAYKPGTFARLADAYDAAGEPERAAFARRMAVQDAFLVPFAQASAEKQQRMIDDLPPSELRDTAQALRGYQASALARDAFAAGTAIYKEVGPPVPIDDIQGRIRQARQITTLRGGAPVVPFTAGEIEGMRRTLATGSEARKQAVRERLAMVPEDMPPTVEAANDTGPANSAPQESSMQTFRLDAGPGMPAESSGGQAGSPAVEPPPGSGEYQAAAEEAHHAASREEASSRVTDRLVTRWIASLDPDDPSPPQLPPELTMRLAPDRKREVEQIAGVTAAEESDSKAYGRILSGLTSYNSQVRLKWAREPLFQYRKFLSAHDFAELALLQNRLDPHSGRLIGQAPIPEDLVPYYDALAPDPEWEYNIFTATDADGRFRFVMPRPLRRFFKGMLDLFAAFKTGELTLDALDSFTAIAGVAGGAFGRGGSIGTRAARDKQHSLLKDSTPALEPSAAASEKLTPRQILARNKALGRTLEERYASKFREQELEVGEQVTIRLKEGDVMVADILTRNPLTKEIECKECKAGQKPTYKPAQRDKHRRFAIGGGTIAGEGRPQFPGGTKLPPTDVELLRDR